MDCNFLTCAEIAKRWGLSERSVRNYCAEGRVPGATLIGKIWYIPDSASKPMRLNMRPKSTLLEVLKMEKESKLSGGIYHKVQVDLTYNSNHIEGSKLSHDQTYFIFTTNTLGIEDSTTNVDDIIETVNHFRCIDKIIDTANLKLTETYIKELHFMLKYGTKDSTKDWFNVGEYKKLPNTVNNIETVSPENVHSEMKALLDEYNEKRFKTLDDLLDFHVRFERIHPFQDGNGRVGRLILFKECIKYNIVPFIIDDEHKMFYYRGLSNWTDERGFLRETCLSVQDKFKEDMDYFKIPYKSENRVKLENKLYEIAPDGKLALAFSGGVDSSILLTVARLALIEVLPLTFDLGEALKIPEVRNNSKERCYYCKSLMMKTLKKRAAAEGFYVLCDGTNADDLKEYRPGLRALTEQCVRSPIAEAGITKAELREIGRELNLPVADEPSSPCMLTRFPYDTFVSDEMLAAVEEAENIVKGAGYKACRVRVYGAQSKIEVPKDEISRLTKENLTERLLETLVPIGVENIEVDGKGLRSGTMDE